VKTFAADLHIHTALSPCASNEMTPPAIVERAVKMRLDIIAVCDHNCAANVLAVQEAAGGRLCVLAGIEITTTEDIHILGIFPHADAALAAGSKITPTLPKASKQYYAKFGEQLIIDAAGHVKGIEGRILASSLWYSLAEAIEIVKEAGGIVIAAHINRPSMSVLSQLGIFPDEAGFDAIEIFTSPQAKVDWNQYISYGLPMIVSSDSHCLSEVGRFRTNFKMAAATFEEFAMAIKGTGGRRVDSINT
jgi:predicted metal-dependent phosphoesterase TrpH